MSERRCPNCAGLVGADAEWCTQCFTRLDESPSVPRVDQQRPAGAVEQVTDGGARPAEATASSAPRPMSEGSAGLHDVRRDDEPLSERETRPAEPTGSRPGGVAGERLIHSRGDRIVWACPACATENPIDSPLCSACGTPFRHVLEAPPEKIDVDPGRAAMFSLFFPGVGHYLIGRRGEGIARGVVFTFALLTGLVSLGAVTRGSGGLYTLLMLLAFGAAAAIYVVSTLDAGRAANGEQQLLPSRVLMYGGIGLMLASLAVVVIGAMGARG